MSNRKIKKRFSSEVKIIDQPKQQVSQDQFSNQSLYQNPFYRKKQVVITPRNKNQHIYYQKLKNDDLSIIFAVGTAGTGKTMLAVQYGIKLLQEGKIEKIVITRPAVSVDEDLGFLPGTLNEKMAPWTRPIFDVFFEYYTQRDINRYLDDGVIEIAPLAYMRGRSLKNAYIIADEMQNSTRSQMKMLLTRIGENSRMVVTGDLAQADRMTDNGLLEFIGRLSEYPELQHIDCVSFNHGDIERHDAVKEVLKIYGEDDM